MTVGESLIIDVYDVTNYTTKLPLIEYGVSSGVTGQSFLYDRTSPGGTSYTLWNGGGYEMNFKTFVDPSVSPAPLPAAFPLFATGLGALCMLGLKRKRKIDAARAA